MNTKQEFNQMMNTQTEIALATCTNGQPNVRIVNFYFDEKSKAVLFATFPDNEKIMEFEINDKVAFTTIPQQNIQHIKGPGVVRKSERTIFDVADDFIKKIPHYKDTVEQAGEHLVLYEITFDTAVVILDFENSETYYLI
jgi:uncharacterized pyridoxamine 5'-phosphate oxidase family protein